MTPPLPLSLRSGLAKLAWSVLAVTVLVIVWGAYVRASGSGAGCGAHWPMCNGEVLPRAPRVATLVEFSHRVSSGLSLLLVLALAIAASRARSPARGYAWAAFGFVCAEALIGAGLVLFALVAHDASAKRGLSMALHLTNTFLLLGALTLAAWRASGGAAPRIRARGVGTLGWGVVAALASVVVVGASGAIAALGDTLFPARSVAAGVLQDFSPAAHVFVRLRVLHPVIAVAGASLVLAVAAAARATPSLRGDRRARRLATLVSAVVGLQLAAGVVNVVLLAPIPMQLVHLLLADAVWIALVLLGAAVVSARPEPAPRATPEVAEATEAAASMAIPPARP